MSATAICVFWLVYRSIGHLENHFEQPQRIRVLPYDNLDFWHITK